MRHGASCAGGFGGLGGIAVGGGVAGVKHAVDGEVVEIAAVGVRDGAEERDLLMRVVEGVAANAAPLRRDVLVRQDLLEPLQRSPSLNGTARTQSRRSLPFPSSTW